ncbi:NADPH:quinone reductase [Bacillus solitudinis]|uniref:NADPH:quinone reductase n=1 Tax=Bacillus solitudinis TaxID=2014074 RepID=UPI000C23C8A0|nr:NADPH:quinone reductase [Bacillus solitudinis]
MKAVIYKQYGDPSVLQLSDVQVPAPQDGEVLIKVGASGINPVDTYFRKGIRPVEKFPHIPHFDVAGEVIEIGTGVTNLRVGDRIWTTNVKGTAAEFICLPENLAFHLPEALSFEEGAALAMPFMTAHLALHYRANVKSSETVLIYGGAGSVGFAAIQIAKQAGATVIATTSNKEKENLAKQAGADEVINYLEADVEEKVNILTNGKGVSIILDMSLSENMEKDFKMISIGGRIVTIGSPIDNTPPLLWRQLNMKNASLLGVLLFSAPATELLKAGQFISDEFKAKSFHAHIGKCFSFGDAAKAHHALEQKTYNGRIILVP